MIASTGATQAAAKFEYDESGRTDTRVDAAGTSTYEWTPRNQLVRFRRALVDLAGDGGRLVRALSEVGRGPPTGAPRCGGDDGNRTHDPLLAKQSDDGRVAPDKATSTRGNGLITSVAQSPLVTGVDHRYWHANGTAAQSMPWFVSHDPPRGMFKNELRDRWGHGVATHDELARNGTTHADAIAAAAGVSTATFYAHFESHDDALTTALDISLTAVVGVAERLFHIEALIEKGLSAVVHDLVSEMHEVFRNESLVMRAALARLPLHQPTREVHRGHEARSLDHLTRQIELGQKAGILREGTPDRRATSLLIVLQGIHNPLLVKKRIDPLIGSDLHRTIHALLSPC